MLIPNLKAVNDIIHKNMPGTKSICPIVVKDIVGNDHFDRRCSRVDDGQPTMKFNISDGQRHNKWSLDDKQRFIYALFNNYSVGMLHLSEHVRHVYTNAHKTEYTLNVSYNIEDGQSRCTVLQEFINDKLLYDGKIFSEMTKDDQEFINNFAFPCEKMSGFSRNELEEMFILINSGKPLNDNDKFISVKHTSEIVRFALDTLGDPRLSQYRKAYDEKTRTCLSDTVAVICTLKHNDLKYLNNSFGNFINVIHDTLCAEEIRRINQFWDFATYVIDQSGIKRKSSLSKLSKFLGILVVDFMLHGANNADMWSEFIYNCAMENFKPYEHLKTGEQRNMKENDWKARHNAVMQLFTQ